MKKYSTARAAIERQYLKVLKEILEEREPVCEGCERCLPLTPSHRIPRSRRRDLIAEKADIDLFCEDCHRHVEAGRYDELKNGEEIKEYIQEADPEYYRIKTVLKNCAL